MLILTRRLGEVICIDDHIKIAVLSIKGSNVRVGIDAPKSVAILREEIYERQHSNDENKEHDESD